MTKTGGGGGGESNFVCGECIRNTKYEDILDKSNCTDFENDDIKKFEQDDALTAAEILTI